MAWERLRRKCRSGIISPCSRTIPACCCPRFPGISHYFPLKKCRKPWWPRNTAVDLAALDVSRAPLRDSPAARLSKRIMNQGLSCRAAQAIANSEVFTNHGFSPWVREGGATGNRRPDHCVRRQVTVSRFTVVHDCSLLFAIVQMKILFGASLHVSPRGEAKWVRGPSGRGSRRLARAGVLERYVEHGKQAQRSPGGRIACFDRRVVRHAGWCPRAARKAVPAARSLLSCALWGGYGAAWAAYCPRAAVRAPSASATRPVGCSRITRHESWPLLMAVRFAVGGQESHNQKLSPDCRARQQVTACLATNSRYFPPFPGKKYCS